MLMASRPKGREAPPSRLFPEKKPPSPALPRSPQSLGHYLLYLPYPHYARTPGINTEVDQFALIATLSPRLLPAQNRDTSPGKTFYYMDIAGVPQWGRRPR